MNRSAVQAAFGADLVFLLTCRHSGSERAGRRLSSLSPIGNIFLAGSSATTMTLILVP